MSSKEPPLLSRRVRLLVIPAILFVSLSGAAFALAKLHLAKPGLPKAAGAGSIDLTGADAYRGQVVFSQNCATCHGPDGKGGGIGPKLQGDRITLAAIKLQIDTPRGTMPPKLVTGRNEVDVIAYLSTIIAKQK